MAVVISWTKEWSSSDDGTVFSGSNLQDLQTDIEGHSHTGGTGVSFADLDDVVITSAAKGDVIFYNGTDYVNLAPGTASQVLTTGGPATNPTWEDAPSTTLTTHGDILYYGVAGLERLAAGTSGQFLQTKGSSANPEWATQTGVSNYAKAYKSGSQQSITTTTKVTFETESFDNNTEFASSTFTAKTAGYYLVTAYLNGNVLNSASIIMHIYKNGSSIASVRQTGIQSGAKNGLSISNLIYLDGSTDYIDIYADESGGSWTLDVGEEDCCVNCIRLLTA